jgi:O-antigen ligase
MTINPRLGFFRAVGSSGHPIMFGAPFVMFLPLIYCLRYERSYWRSLAYVLSGVAAIGALSSMSSGPWMMVLMVVGCLMVEPYGRRLKQFLVLAFVMAVLVEIVSNRPIYHVVVTYANPIGGTGWHRAMLIDLAVENFNEWWLCGYRGVDPGWGPSLGMGWTDITNEYIATGVMYGLLGVIALIGVIVVAIRKLVHLRRSTKDPVLRSWFWALGTVIVMMAVSFNSCALFSQADMVFYCILGIVGSSGNLLLGTLNKRQLAVQTSSV